MAFTAEQITREVARIGYLDWAFTVFEDPWDGLTLRIEATVADSHHPGQTTVLGIDTPIPPLADVQAFLDWIGWRLRRIEAHEVRERLTSRGFRVFEPHPEQATVARFRFDLTGADFARQQERPDPTPLRPDPGVPSR